MSFAADVRARDGIAAMDTLQDDRLRRAENPSRSWREAALKADPY